MTRKTGIIVSLFDQKAGPARDAHNAKLVQMKRVRYKASDIIRYCTRLEILPGPYTPPMNVPFYITRSGEVGAVAFRNFELDDLAGMARELERDALLASTKLSRPWIHGCISIEVSPTDYDGEPDDLLDMGHSLMKMFGVDDNRYMLAVHMDSGSIHVHFLYSRVDSQGAARERDRKMPKFMAEEATALLAHQFGFSLAPRHLSRVTPGGILDLASDRIVRGLDFCEILDGMKSRNTARKKTKGNDLLTLALVARHEATNLLEFRKLLAPHGITYEKRGSGAEFVDLAGRRLMASDVDSRRRFTPTNMFNGALVREFPQTPDHLRRQADGVRANAKLAHDVYAHASLASANPSPNAADAARKQTPAYDDKREIERFLSDRGPNDINASRGESHWDKAVVGGMKSKPGRPIKGPILPGWPEQIKIGGSLGSPHGHRRRIKFPEPQYANLEKPSQTEIWRDGELIASIRYSRMAILSSKEADLREALIAAHRAWGTVEVFGKPKFKLQMAKLAAEMGIPVSNPELQEGMVRIKKAKQPAVQVPLPQPAVMRMVPISTEGCVEVSRKPAGDAQSQLNVEGTPLAPAAPVRVNIGVTKPDTDRPAQTPNRDILAAIKRGNWPIRPNLAAPSKWTLYPNEIQSFQVNVGDLEDSEVQAQLADSYWRQQGDLASMAAAIRGGTVRVTMDTATTGQETLRLHVPPGSRLEKLRERCQPHPDFNTLMRAARHDFVERQKQTLPSEVATQTRVTAEAQIPSAVPPLAKLPISEGGDSTLPTVRLVGPPPKAPKDDAGPPPLAVEGQHSPQEREPPSTSGPPPAIVEGNTATRNEPEGTLSSPLAANTVPTETPAPPSDREQSSWQATRHPDETPQLGQLLKPGSSEREESPQQSTASRQAEDDADAKAADRKKNEVERVEQQARLAKEIAELMRPRIFGMNGGSRLAEAPKTAVVGESTMRLEGVIPPKGFKEAAEPMIVDPQKEAIKAAAASDRSK